LEVGGGRGYLQQAASGKGWETLGIELSRYAIKSAIASGLTVLPITLGELYSEYIPYARYFDVIAMFDFLEHVTDPGQVLRVIRDLLKDDGVLVLRLPVTGARPELHLIDHIWHFTIKTMNLLFLKERFRIASQHDSGTFFSLEGKKLDNITVFLTKQD
jgi:2-polyprenyl-3-methyl-5-hydroxy-6-metoxy-1,4-benzoquinol methylase